MQMRIIGAINLKANTYQLSMLEMNPSIKDTMVNIVNDKPKVFI